MNFYKHHLGDYAAATSHLSWDEDCAYRRLIDQYYKREVSIPTDIKEACRLARASSLAQRRAVESVLREFFVLQADGWHQKRCDAELVEAEEQGGERSAKAENERERQRRHRAERKRLFEQLRELDIVPAWDTKTETLRAMLQVRPVTPAVTQPERDESPPVTPPVTRTATANQTPDSRLHKEDRGKGTARKRATPPPDRPDDVPEQTWDDWLQLRKGKRAAVTETLLAEARTEAEKAGLTLARFLAAWCLRGSQGFSADWIKPDERGHRGNGANGAVPDWRREQRERMQQAAPYAAVGKRSAKPIFDIEEFEDEKRSLPAPR